MKTGSPKRTVVVTSNASLSSARRALLRWILKNEAQRRAARTAARFTGVTACR